MNEKLNRSLTVITPDNDLITVTAVSPRLYQIEVRREFFGDGRFYTGVLTVDGRGFGFDLTAQTGRWAFEGDSEIQALAAWERELATTE